MKKLLLITSALFLCLNLYSMNWWRTIVSTDNTTEKKTVKTKPYEIFVRNLVGKTIAYYCPNGEETTIEELKRLIKKKEDQNMPIKSMRLTFNGQQLRDEKNFKFHKVRNESTIHLMLRLKGGNQGAEFYDFDNANGAKNRKQWSSDAPKSRVHWAGANLIGTCENSECEFYGRRVVSGLGHGKFTIIKNNRYEVDAKCPICKKSIVPKTCAFNNCYYRVKGRKSDGGATLVKSSWRRVGDECLICEERGNTAQYAGLIIFSETSDGVCPEESDEEI
jgi:ubiquitin-large subunit ribosomal protein L40e